MNDTIMIRGIAATQPRHTVTTAGLAISSFRLASTSRRWDRASGSWTNGDTNWFTVTSFRSLADNVDKSVNKGDRLIVTGRLRIRNWEANDRSGVNVEIDADGVGLDLAWGRGQWMKVPRHTAEEAAAPGEVPTVAERGTTVDTRAGEVTTAEPIDDAATAAEPVPAPRAASGVEPGVEPGAEPGAEPPSTGAEDRPHDDASPF